MSGVVPDARTLIDYARVQTQTYWFDYDEPMSVKRCASSIAEKCAGFGEGEMARPYGVSLLIAGVDEEGPRLFCVDPSGTSTKYKARAIGSGSEGAQSMLKDQYSEDMTLEQARTLALDILKQVMEEKITEHNVELTIIPLDISA